MDLLASEKPATSLSLGALGSILYHDIFDYPLSLPELFKWELGGDFSPLGNGVISFKDGFYLISGRDGIVLKRLMRKRISARKFSIAEKAAKILGLIPTIKAVAITGALAMENADEDADVDLLVITRKGTLWTTRLLTLGLLALIGFPTRRFGDRNQKDKLCLNMWLDESVPGWPREDRNIYTAHEIAQIIPLINKDRAYEEFLYKNRWLREFWPSASKILSEKDRGGLLKKHKMPLIFGVVEPLARKIQFWYMRGKITREVVGKSKAIFHPHDWGSLVSSKLAKLGFRT